MQSIKSFLLESIDEDSSSVSEVSSSEDSNQDRSFGLSISIQYNSNLNNQRYFKKLKKCKNFEFFGKIVILTKNP